MAFETANIGAFILAGGKSLRMGASKPLLQLAGETLLERAVLLVSPFVESCNVVGPAELREHTRVGVVEDAYPGCGPLGGIATALNFAALRPSQQTWNLILACDMPYLMPEWLRYLIARAIASESDVVMARDARGWEPLCAMYRSAAGMAISAALERGVRKVTGGLAGLKVDLVEPAEWKRFDSHGWLFKNVNTPEEYRAAQEFFEETPEGR
jgi:molybdopterin-guanine dinucleotide biosynthesis protein A